MIMHGQPDFVLPTLQLLRTSTHALFVNCPAAGAALQAAACVSASFSSQGSKGPAQHGDAAAGQLLSRWGPADLHYAVICGAGCTRAQGGVQQRGQACTKLACAAGTAAAGVVQAVAAQESHCYSRSGRILLLIRCLQQL